MATRQKNSIESTISEYNTLLSSMNQSGSIPINLELEAKIQEISLGSFTDSIKSMSEKNKLVGIECSINKVSTVSDTSSNIVTYVYDRNVSTSKSESTKKSVGSKFYSNGEFMKYTLAIAKEIPTDPSVAGKNVSINAFCRFKIRLSFASTASPGYRYDYTLVNHVEQFGRQTGDIDRIRKELFASIGSTMTITEVLPIFMTIARNPGIKLEIEVERTLQTPIESRVELDSALDTLWKTFDNTFVTGDQRLLLIREVYDLISKNSVQKKLTLKNILNAAQSLTKSKYYQEVYPPLGYFVTDKADGERCLVYATGSFVHAIHSTLETAPLTTPVLKTAIDCELITLKNGKRRLGIFDVLYCNDQNVSGMTIEDRMTYAPAALANISEALAGLGIDCFVKEYIQISQPIEEAVLKVRNKPRDYKTDGLILTSQTGSYYETKNYKWKPTEENTIDFMVIDCPKTMLGKKEMPDRPGFKLYCLLSGMNAMRRKYYGITLWPTYTEDTGVDRNGPYVPVLFRSMLWPYSYLYYAPIDSTHNNDLHGRICEFAIADKATETLKSAFSKGTVDSSLDIWTLVRLREDRSVTAGEFGNDFDIAEDIFSSIIDPFYIEDLWQGSTSYFEKTRDSIYRASNKFKRFVIKKAFDKYLTSDCSVLDLAAGRGADLGPYMTAGIGRLVAIDIDPTALVELIRRSSDKHITSLRRSNKPIKINVLVSDVSGNPNVNKKALLDRFAVTSTDIVVCNFAFHYFCTSSSACNNALSFVGDMCAPGAIFIMTVLDGASVFKLLEPIETGHAWSVIENSVEKYLIRKDYDTDTFASYGQKISVKLPMTTKLYQEPLCNIEQVVADAKQYGLEHVSTESFGDYLSQFSTNDPQVSQSLSRDDINYCKMHSLVIFRKKMGKTGGSYSKWTH